MVGTTEIGSVAPTASCSFLFMPFFYHKIFQFWSFACLPTNTHTGLTFGPFLPRGYPFLQELCLCSMELPTTSFVLGVTDIPVYCHLTARSIFWLILHLLICELPKDEKSLWFPHAWWVLVVWGRNWVSKRTRTHIFIRKQAESIMQGQRRTGRKSLGYLKGKRKFSWEHRNVFTY